MAELLYSISLRWLSVSDMLIRIAASLLLLSISLASLGEFPFRTLTNQDDTWNQTVEVFKSKIYPLLGREDSGCFDCHSTDSNSNLIFSGNAEEDLHMLVDGQYLDGSNPDSLMARLTSSNGKRRMPQGDAPWSKDEIDRLDAFVRLLSKEKALKGTASDERFPRALLQPYHGDQTGKIDNQFISYRQLKAKVAVIFEDDWVRGGNDLFAENVSLFGGADFETRFNETRDPSAAFLTGLEMLADDVSHRAYERKSGPFDQWTKPTASPLENPDPTPDYRVAISRLYEKILFRTPTATEMEAAYDLLRAIYQSQDLIASRNHQLSFELLVSDPQTGFQTKQLVEIPVNGDRLDVHQQIVDQSKKTENDDGRISKCVIGPAVELNPETEGQRLVIHNLGTMKNISFAGVEITREDSGESVKSILVSSPELQMDGAWQVAKMGGFKSVEDRNNHKGKSTITVPLSVEHAGLYRITMLWRKDAGNAHNVLTELYAKGAGNQLAPSANPKIPGPGEARFYYDCGDDTISFFQPGTAFLFDDDGYVEVSNRGTRKRVTAGAVEFVQRSDPTQHFLVDSREAEGNENWDAFDEGTFKAYNVKGKKLHDNNKRKGELSLRYKPVANLPTSDTKTKTRRVWKADEFYDFRVYFPGKVNQESQVPIVVKASKSSPIIQLKYPLLAKSDCKFTLDASESYTVQHSELQFSWRQIAGSPVDLGEGNQSKIEFTVPRPDIEQFAWSSLCAGLIQHPDFLFTRPPSIFSLVSPQDKRRLQLVKIALDLVGRPPNTQELTKLDNGAKIADLADSYLDSDEFREFYFHRIRLMLESHGSEMDDEPTRLWCYVAFNDRPFQEILTGEYTVDSELKKITRPTYHGKTGLLTTQGFIKGKPGLPHYNYAAQVSMLFLGYVYEVPDEIVEQREGVTALGTTDPNSACYSCHKILTPLAFQRLNWNDQGVFRTRDENDLMIDASDRGAVAEYPFAGNGMAAFATQAVRKERFIRTMINTHVNFYFGRPMRHREDERVLYKRLWDNVHKNEFKIRELIRAIVNSPEYLGGDGKSVEAK